MCVPYILVCLYARDRSKDEALYIRNGLVEMLERNVKIKDAPERWQVRYDVSTGHCHRLCV